jgi:uncharacterized protein
MAEQIVSPGVFTRENDQSFISQQPVEVGAAIIGPAVKGPVEVPTVVTSYSQYENIFGAAFLSSSQTYSFLTSVSAYNYFQNGGDTLLVTRVASGSFTSAESAGTLNGNGGAVSLASDALLASITTQPSASAGTYTGVSSSLVTGTGLSLTGSITLNTNTNTSAITVTASSGSFSIGDVITFPSASLGAGASGGTNLVITLDSSDFVGTTTNTPFVLKTFSEGIIMNNDGTLPASDGSLISGSLDNVRWEITQASTSSGTFTLNIRQGNDITNEKTVLETFANVSLDPESSNYVSKVIGDTYQTIQTDSDGNSYIQPTGNFPNNSSYVYVSAVNTPTPNYFNNSGVAKTAFTSSIPVVGNGAFGGATGDILTGDGLYYENITDDDTQGLVAANYSVAISLLNNKDAYQYNVISTPGLIHTFPTHASVLNTLIANTQNRGDSIAIVDLENYGATITATSNAAVSINSSYAAAYWPWLQITNPNTGKLNWTPASTLIPGVYAFNDASSEPWFAPAGINRGGLSTVVRPERKLTRAQRDTLYESNVNPIANFPATGTVVFGQKTLQKKASALDRVNVRRLLIALKSYIGQVANNLVFEQNSIATRNSFLAQVNPYMESVQQRQGVYAFKVVMDSTNNTPDVVDRNQMVGQIFLQPTRTAEFIILDFNVLPTGAEFPA